MADIKAWIVLLVLVSLHGNSDSQTDDMITMYTDVTGTAPPTFRTLPPTPPPSIPPPPPTASVEPPPTTDPPVTTRTPPPPPPPSPPPPPPSSVVPPTPTPALPTTTSRTPTTRMLRTTVAEPTDPVVKTTRPPTEPAIVEPNPVAESLGKIGVLLTVALEDFDRPQFQQVMAQEVNNFCAEYPEECTGAGKIVSARDVVIVNAKLYEGIEVNDARRRLLQEEQILVEYYVQDPRLSTNVMLTTEQQRVFLANDDVQTSLQTNIDGYEGIAPVYGEPTEAPPLEGWEIALIVIGSVAAAGLVIGAVGFHVSKSKAKSKQLDVELQEKKTAPLLEHTGNDYATVESNGSDKATVEANGLDKTKKKPPLDEADVSTQVKYKDILDETGFEPSKRVEAKESDNKPNGGTSMVVTAEISSGSSTSSENGELELDATAQKQQEVPPNYEPPPPMTPTTPADVADVMTEFDNLVSSQSNGLAVNSAEFQNPAFEEDSTGL